VVLALVMTALIPGPAWSAESAPPADQTLKRLEHDLSAGRDRQTRLERQSESLKADLMALRGRLVAASDAAAKQQADLEEIEAALANTEAEEHSQSTGLSAQRRSIADLVGALYRLSLTPPEALIARPEAPVDALRTALLLEQALPAVRARADALAQALNRVQELRRQLQAERDRVEATRTAFTAKLSEIAGMVTQREALARDTEAERQQVAQRLSALVAQATDLRQLVERIETDRRPAPERSHADPAPPLPDAGPSQQNPDHAAPHAGVGAGASLGSGTGVFRLPAVGRVAVAYGDPDRFGTTSRGLHIAAQPGTPVVAPLDGTIRFAGSFRAYGQLLIVEHGNGYHSLIAGLGRIDTAVGRSVSAGEPVGVVADPGEDGAADLYFELRRNGQPVNPRRGIPALDGKGQG
jgi:septal ring factor EnvC (AmiA/AmiB activator)